MGVSGAVITDLITGKIHLKQKEVTRPCGWVPVYIKELQAAWRETAIEMEGKGSKSS